MGKTEEKLTFIGGLDPFQLCPLDRDYKILPFVTYQDIANYVIFDKSAYTADYLTTYKGLDVYNQMICGWVREMQCEIIEGKTLVKAKVSISYRKS